MGRIVAIDYGGKRCGIAVTDPMQIIATPLTTVHSKDLMEFLKKYVETEPVDAFVVGEPLRLDDSPAQSMEMVQNFVKHLGRTFPEIPIHWEDERYTSKMAAQSMIESGMKKKNRQKKENLDMISATIILQSFMNK